MEVISLIVNNHKLEYKDNILTVTHIFDIDKEEVFNYKINNIKRLEYEMDFYLRVWINVEHEEISFKHIDFFNKIRGCLEEK